VPHHHRTTPTSAWVIPLGVALGIALALVSALIAVAIVGGQAAPLGRIGRVPVSGAATPANIASVTAAISEPTPTPSPTATAAAFDAKRALAIVKKISSFGPRPAGSAAESRAVDYVRGQFEALGYPTTVETVPLPGGKHTHNVVAHKAGGGSGLIVLGGHIDSKPPSPGANDDASGVAVILELARVMRSRGSDPSIEFVAFGGEETAGTADQHHYGSRAHAFALRGTRPERSTAMIAVDMVGVGKTFNVRSMGKGPQGLVTALGSYARQHKVTLKYLKDTARYGSADHEPFELSGVPAAWIQWRSDPNYHTVRDVPARISSGRIASTGSLLLDFLGGLTSDDITAWYGK